MPYLSISEFAIWCEYCHFNKYFVVYAGTSVMTSLILC